MVLIAGLKTEFSRFAFTIIYKLLQLEIMKAFKRYQRKLCHPSENGVELCADSTMHKQIYSENEVFWK